MARDLCRLALTCRLTRDPELRSTPSGMSVCSMRVAYTTARKNPDGSWSDKSNYLDVTVWGNQGERCAQYLGKGRRVAVDGRLEWREWEAQDGSGKRHAYDLIADSVIFLDYKEDGAGGNSGGEQFQPAGAPAGFQAPATATDDFQAPPAAATGDFANDVDSDIPF
jgi:single-strand DNA-binding protein